MSVDGSRDYLAALANLISAGELLQLLQPSEQSKQLHSDLLYRIHYMSSQCHWKLGRSADAVKALEQAMHFLKESSSCYEDGIRAKLQAVLVESIKKVKRSENPSSEVEANLGGGDNESRSQSPDDWLEALKAEHFPEFQSHPNARSVFQLQNKQFVEGLVPP